MSRSMCLSVLSVIFSFILLSTPVVSGENLEVRIVQPQQNAEVGLTHLVRGNVSDPNARVRVLVHPLLTNLWWVQRPPSPPNQDGSWQTVCYFGTETEGVDEYFELIAIVTRERLDEGQTLSNLPDGAIRSDIIAVKRTK